MKKTIMILTASTRPGRMGTPVAEWVRSQIASIDGELTLDVVDLEDLALPFLDEPAPPMEGAYEKEHTKAWSTRVQKADGFVIVTPEYNAGYPAPLKNAIDYLYAEWEGKPVAFVGYGAGPATNAIKQLKEVTERIKMVNVEAGVAVPQIWQALNEDGSIKEDAVHGSIKELVTELTSKLG